ncbi:MAG: hypothetical protein WC732_08745 [Candidatus Omnitrophota bacterium]
MVSHEEEPFFEMVDDLVMSRIASFLVPPSVVGSMHSFRQTCKRAHAVADSPLVWEHIDVGELVTSMCNPKNLPCRQSDAWPLPLVQRTLGALSRVNLTLCAVFDGARMPVEVCKHLVARMPNLRELSMWLSTASIRGAGPCNRDFADTLAFIRRACPDLTSLRIIAPCLTTCTTTTVKLPKVTALRLECPPCVVAALSASCVGLRDVRIETLPARCAGDDTAHAAAELLVAHCATLENFWVDELVAPPSQPAWPKMRSFGIGVYSAAIRDWIWPAIATRFPQLETLGIMFKTDDQTRFMWEVGHANAGLEARPDIWLDVTILEDAERIVSSVMRARGTFGRRIRRLQFNRWYTMPAIWLIPCGAPNIAVVTAYNCWGTQALLQLLHHVSPDLATLTMARGATLDIAFTPPAELLPCHPGAIRPDFTDRWMPILERMEHLWTGEPSDRRTRIMFV